MTSKRLDRNELAKLLRTSDPAALRRKFDAFKQAQEHRDSILESMNLGGRVFSYHGKTYHPDDLDPVCGGPINSMQFDIPSYDLPELQSLLPFHQFGVAVLLSLGDMLGRDSLLVLGNRSLSVLNERVIGFTLADPNLGLETHLNLATHVPTALCEIVEDSRKHEYLRDRAPGEVRKLVLCPFLDKKTTYQFDYLKCESLFHACADLFRQYAVLALDLLHIKIALHAAKLDAIPIKDIVAHLWKFDPVFFAVGDIRKYGTMLRQSKEPGWIAEELIRLLYQADQRSIIDSIFIIEKPKDVDVDQFAARIRGDINQRALDSAQKLNKEDVEYCISQFRGEMGATEGYVIGIKNIWKSIHLSDQGFDIEDAVFLVRANVDDRLLELHQSVDGSLEYYGLDHQKLARILTNVPKTEQQTFIANLDAYFEWLDLMPGSHLIKAECIELSAFLAIVVPEVPENRQSAGLFLTEKQGQILDKLASLDETRADQLFNVFERYSTWLQSFKQTGKFEEVPEEQQSRANVIIRPHKTLMFDLTIQQAISDAKIPEDDLRLALAYGLRLSSGNKAAIGGKYFPLDFFRQNCRRLFEKNGNNASKRLGDVEKFLTSNGVVSYYQKDRIRLNVKDDSGYTPSTDIGSAILDAVIGWRNELFSQS